VTSSPAIGPDGMIYFGAWDDRLYAVHAFDGSTKWTYATGDDVGSSPALSPDFSTVYVGSEDRNLHAVHTANGTARWTYLAGAGITASPMVGPDGSVFIASSDAVLHAVSEAGEARWTFRVGSAITTAAAVDPGTVYVGANDDKLYAIHAGTGVLRWTFTAGGQITSTPALALDVLYFGASDKVAYAVRATDGALQWTYRTTANVGFSATIAHDGTVFMPTTRGIEALFTRAPITLRPERALSATAVDVTASISDFGAIFAPLRNRSWVCSFGPGASDTVTVPFSTARMACTVPPPRSLGSSQVAVRLRDESSQGLVAATVTVVSAPFPVVDTVSLLLLGEGAGGNPQRTLVVRGSSFAWQPRCTVAGEPAPCVAIRDGLHAPTEIHISLAEAIFVRLNSTARAGASQTATVPGARAVCVANSVDAVGCGGIDMQDWDRNEQVPLRSSFAQVWPPPGFTRAAPWWAGRGRGRGNAGTAAPASASTTTTTASLDPTQSWTYSAGADIDSSPAIADGVVFVGSDDHRLHAVDAATGAARWIYVTGDDITSSPAVSADGVVYVGSWDYRLHAVFADNGTAKWVYDIGSVVRSSPAIAPDGSTVYVGAWDNNLHAVNAADGTRRWIATTGGSVDFSPAISPFDGTVFVGSGENRLFAVDPATGAVKWSYRTGGDMTSMPAVARDGRIFVASWDNKLHALDAGTVLFFVFFFSTCFCENPYFSSHPD
jgi:outer membrane protein assembly factor BamB